jgi:hypothetical protein
MWFRRKKPQWQNLPNEITEFGPMGGHDPTPAALRKNPRMERQIQNTLNLMETVGPQRAGPMMRAQSLNAIQDVSAYATENGVNWRTYRRMRESGTWSANEARNAMGQLGQASRMPLPTTAAAGKRLASGGGAGGAVGGFSDEILNPTLRFMGQPSMEGLRGLLFNGGDALTTLGRGAMLGAAAVPATFSAMNATRSMQEGHYGRALMWTGVGAGSLYAIRKASLRTMASDVAKSVISKRV